MLTSAEVAAMRLHAQSLAHTHSGTVLDVVAQVGGIQAQSLPAALWSVGVRMAASTAAEVEQARVVERSVVMTWAMRGTRHLVATRDYGWLLPLFAPYTLSANRSRYADLALSDTLISKTTAYIRDFLLNHGAQTRHAIGDMLSQHGISTEGQRLIHIIARAALAGVICLGDVVDGEERWVAVEGWIEVKWEEDAIAALVRSYFTAFAPATADDCAAWAGLPKKEIARGIDQLGDTLIEIESEVGRLLALRGQVAAPLKLPIVRLLPPYDTYLLGYRSRDFIVAPPYAKRIHPGGGILHATLLVNHQAAGTWQLRHRRTTTDLIIRPFAPLSSEVKALLETEADKMGQFLEKTIRYVISDE
jgi:hypothetical protein